MPIRYTGGDPSDPVEWAARDRSADLPDVDPELLNWPEGPGPDTSLCFGRLTPAQLRAYQAKGSEATVCVRVAGWGTDHPGVGYCRQHGGNTPDGRREAALAVGHKFGQALDVTPWEGLLLAVKIAAGKVAFIEHKLSQARSDQQFKPPDLYDASVEDYDDRPTSVDSAGQKFGLDDPNVPGARENLNWWTKESKYWHGKLAATSKMAIDAGVAERLVRQVELEAALMLRATNRLLDDLGLQGDARERALIQMSTHLLELEAEDADLRTINGVAT